MKKTLAAVLLAAVSAPAAAATATPPTFRLGDAAVPQSYELRLAIDPRQPRFGGEVHIAFRVARAMPVLWLNAEAIDIAQARFTRADRTLEARVLPAKRDFAGFEIDGGFPPGDYTADIRFEAPIEPLATRGLFREKEEGEWYAITQFEALSARRAFPSFDEPQWKTPWRIVVDAPAADRAVSNAPEESVADTPGRAGWKRHVFATTKPLTTYLVAFAVGPFEAVQGGKAGAHGTPLAYYTPKGRAEEARYAHEATPRLLGLLEDYFGIPYPFEKLDAVPIPATVGFGAMENAGMITYSSELLLAKPARETLG